MAVTQRNGTPLIINQQEIEFTRWPARKSGQSHILQTEILTKNGWDAIEAAIQRRFRNNGNARDMCLSFLDQAYDFYKGFETSQRAASRPLLLYYSFMNLAKSLILFRDVASELGDAMHGLREDRKPFRHATIFINRDTGRKREVFDLFAQALGNSALQRDLRVKLVSELLPQIVVGHRLWAEAAGCRERFIRAEQIAFQHNPDEKLIWIIIDIKKSDLRGLNISSERFLKYSGLQATFKEVIPKNNPSKPIVRFEQITSIHYPRSPTEKLSQLASTLDGRLWFIIRSVPPYRRYYLWAAEALSDRILHPLLSVYLVVFYLGSVTRYRPYYFEELQESMYGNLFDEIVQTQGQQMLFQMAAEFRERDISWPAVI
jgi:hypothetical protein